MFIKVNLLAKMDLNNEISKQEYQELGAAHVTDLD